MNVRYFCKETGYATVVTLQTALNWLLVLDEMPEDESRRRLRSGEMIDMPKASYQLTKDRTTQ